MFFRKPKPDAKPKTEPTLAPRPARASLSFNPSDHRAIRKPYNPEAVQDFQPYKPAPGVVPDGQLAMDSYGYGADTNAYFMNNAVADGVAFMGYPRLAEMGQRAEYRHIVSVLAEEATREWIEFRGTGDDDKKDRIAELEAEFERLRVRAHFRHMSELDSMFGIGQLYVDMGLPYLSPDNSTPLLVKPETIRKGKLRGFVAVEPIWTSPNEYNSENALAEDFYRPKKWWVMGANVNSSRLLRFVSREVSQLLKPTYNFGGVPLIQLAKPYVDNWVRTRQSVSDLINGCSIVNLKTDLASVYMQSGVDGLIERIEQFQRFRDNRGVFLTDQESEELEILSVNLSGLGELQNQALEQICVVAQMPLVKFAGIQPSGLNACLPANTLIFTDRGHVCISDVTLSDKVLTREGFAPLKFSGKTKYAKELYEIKTESKTLLCTGNHPIWIKEAGKFVPAENVQVGQSLLLIGEKHDIPNMHHQSHGAEDGGGCGKMATILRGIAKKSVQFISTGLSGKLIATLLKKGGTCTTKMGTSGITKSPIWSRCAQKITLPFMRLTSLSGKGQKGLVKRKSAHSARKHSLWKKLLAGLSFALMIVAWRKGGKIDHRPPSRSLYAHASIAALNTLLLGKIVSFVVGNVILAFPNVRKGAERAQKLITKLIQKSGRQKNTNPKDESVVQSVRTIKASEWVYDLSVEDGYLPEFYANGILTHNSSDGEIRVWYDRVAAYQESFFGPHLKRVMHMAMLNIWGEIDEDIEFRFVPLWQLDEAAQAAIQKTKADTFAVYCELGAASNDEVREALNVDEDTPFSGVDMSGPGYEPLGEEEGDTGSGGLGGVKTLPNPAAHVDNDGV